jgi:LCP family protein required for cell wall assembly
MLRNSRFIVFLIIASMTYLTSCRDASIPDIQVTDTASVTAAVLKENDQITPTPTSQESVETKKTSTYSGTDLTAQSTRDVDSKDIEKTTPEIPKVVSPFNLPSGTEIIAILGTDYPYPHIGRTDSILLLFLNKSSGNASLLSIPSDVYIYQSDQTLKRINTQFRNGGSELFFDTLEYNLGFRPNHWVLIHFDSFVEFVDDQGGIVVEVGTPLPNDCGGIPAGIVNMDGATALCYVREIRTSSEFERNRRMLEVLNVILQKSVRFENIKYLPDWYRMYRQTIQSNMGLFDLIRYFPIAIRVKESDRINFFQISPEDLIQTQISKSGRTGLVIEPDKLELIMRNLLTSLTK